MLVSENAPSELKHDELSDDDVEQLIGYIADNSSAKRVYWFLCLLDEKGKNSKSKKWNLQNHIGSMLNKIGSDQYYWHIAELIEKLSSYDLTNYVTVIFSKIKDDQDASNMKRIAQSLKICGKIKPNFSNYIELILKKLKTYESSDKINDMAELIKEFKDCNLADDHIQKILSKIGDNQDASNMKQIVKSLKECKINLNNYIESILDKLKNNQSAAGIFADSGMASLIKEFKDCNLTNEHVKKILSKTKDDVDAHYMSKLVNSLRECRVLVQNYFESILGKITDSLADDMAKLITEFKNCNLTDDHVQKILNKTKGDVAADDMAALVKSLSECDVQVQNYIESILSKITDNSANSMAKLITEFKGCNLTDEHVQKILSKTKNNVSASDMVKLVKSLKECDVPVQNYFGFILDKLAKNQSVTNMLDLAKYLKNGYNIDQILADIINCIQESKEQDMSLIAELINLVSDSKFKDDVQYYNECLAKIKLNPMDKNSSIKQLVELVEELPVQTLENEPLRHFFNKSLDSIYKYCYDYSKQIEGIISLISALVSKNFKNDQFYNSLLDRLAQINSKMGKPHSITNLITMIIKKLSSGNLECIKQVFIDKLKSLNLKQIIQQKMKKNNISFEYCIEYEMNQIVSLIGALVSKNIKDGDIYTSVLNLFTDIEYKSGHEDKKVVHVIDSIIQLVEPLTKDNLNFIRQYFEAKLKELKFVSIKSIKTLIKTLAKKDITWVSDVFGIMLNKLGNDLSAQSMTSLIQALTENKVQLKDEQVKIMLNKLGNDLSVQSMTSLIQAVTQNKVQLKDEQVKIILNKLDQESTTNSVLDFIEGLKDNHKDITLDSNVYAAIFGSFEKSGVYSILNLIQNLTMMDIQLKNKYIKMFLDKLKNDLSLDGVSSFITTLTNNNIKLTNEHIERILNKLKNGLSLDDVSNFITTLTEKKIPLNDGNITIILNKLVKLDKDKQLTNTSSLIKFTDELTNDGIKLKTNHLKIMLSQLKDGYCRATDNNGDDTGLISLLNKLKKCNADLNFDNTVLLDILYKKLQNIDDEKNALN